METEKDEHWVWMANYLKGEIAEEEMHALLAWVKKNPENKELFDRTTSTWHLTGQLDSSYMPDIEKGWQRFKQSIAPEVNTTQPIHSTGPVEAKTIRLNKTYLFLRVAALILFFVGVVYLANIYLTKEPELITQHTELEKTTLVLPDGSKIVLNKYSRVSYEPHFEDKRIVYLTGEAFFDVQKMKGKPFIIYTGNTKTEVLGTSFIIKSDTLANDVEVMVVTGKVAFSLQEGKEKQTVYLTPGDKGMLQNQRSIVKTKISDPNFLAWKEEKLEFSNTKLNQVAETLEDYFGVPIQLDNPQLSTCRFTGSFENPALQNILEVLSASVNLTYTSNNNQYILSGEGCQ